MVEARPHALDPFRLEGRAALVTGGARGLGRIMAEALAEAGAAAWSRVAARRRLARPPPRSRLRRAAAWSVSAATSRPPTGVEQLVRGAGEAFGHVDILVNNAGVNIRGVPGTCRRPTGTR